MINDFVRAFSRRTASLTAKWEYETWRNLFKNANVSMFTVNIVINYGSKTWFQVFFCSFQCNIFCVLVNRTGLERLKLAIVQTLWINKCFKHCNNSYGDTSSGETSDTTLRQTIFYLATLCPLDSSFWEMYSWRFFC